MNGKGRIDSEKAVGSRVYDISADVILDRGGGRSVKHQTVSTHHVLNHTNHAFRVVQRIASRENSGP
jgi:hypothetical protein